MQTDNIMNMETSKSAHLLAEGYELVKGLTIPLGITNKDLEADNLEPKNAKKLSIDGAQGKGKLNLYIFRPANVGEDEKTPVIYYSHGGGYQFGKGSLEAGKDADFLVFDKDLLTAEHEGFSYNAPTDVYLGGKKMK